MARSARELFEEAMRLDPAERATLMRLLIDTLDAESEEGAEDAWRAEVERRIAELDSGAVERSEEHTSELQSHHDLVCRLLLEKKKKRRMGAAGRARDRLGSGADH